MAISKGTIEIFTSLASAVIKRLLRKNSTSNGQTENTKSDSSMALSENMNNDDENAFITNLQSKLTKVPLGNPTDVINAINSLGEAACDTVKFCEIQENKRTAIRAQRDVMIRQIDQTADLIRTYLDKTFDERRYQFDKYFALVDKAIDTGDSDLLGMSLQSINQLAASSPFKDLKSIADTIKNPDAVWEI